MNSEVLSAAPAFASSSEVDGPPLEPNVSDSRRWNAELELWFGYRDERTRLLRRRHLGPLVVQRPFYPERDGTCHVYLLHPPAGVAAGDELHFTFHLDAGARAVLTTPGAGKFYRCAAGKGAQRSLVDIAANAVCEYLPQETIIFDGAIAEIGTRVTLGESATFVGWDFLCLGRPAAGERFRRGAVTQRIEIRREGRPIWFERLHVAGGSPLLNAAYAFAGHPVVGTMVYAGPLKEGVADTVRKCVPEAKAQLFSVSQLGRTVVCRYLGQHAEEGKSLFIRAWDALRTELQAKPACSPRIWAT